MALKIYSTIIFSHTTACSSLEIYLIIETIDYKKLLFYNNFK